MIKGALKYFNLRPNFTEEELNKAYYNQINVIPVNFKEKKVDSDMSEKIQIYYMILYKYAKIRYIEETYLKDVVLEDEQHQQINTVLNLPKSIAKFYKDNYFYHSEVDSLLNNIKLDFNILCYSDMDTTKTKEEVDDCLNKFKKSMSENYNKFLEGCLEVFASSKSCDISQLKVNYNIKEDSSVKELMIDVYNLLDKIIIVDKKELRSEFCKLANELLEQGSEDYYVAMKNYSLMLKEYDDAEFLKVYGDATKNLNKAILKEYYKEVQKELIPGTDEYITAMEYYGFLSVEDNHQKFLSLYNEAKEYIDGFTKGKKSPKK